MRNFVDASTRIPALRARLTRSASKRIDCARLSVLDRRAMQILIEKGEVEMFPSPKGRGNAYRFVTQPG